ncbi:ABC transporter ATP-binding protein [Mycetocola tolaasinivorans]|uniref:ABC transporter ATP-binding protein n=1 Tax=Mycetocola tolaasinivorans TaxID=76635 RepID=A0A3L7A5E8_9MICO|nr:ABC transporter ATP-binding protein [Mycetocola tolaasinivorans]RLP75275.1 ABC transporter ATP-binding protein [Mycetocola tolaasinivorans]
MTLTDPAVATPAVDHTDSVLRISDLSIAYSAGAGRRVEAVRGVSLHVQKGETVALVGGSGSGKSTIALSTLGLLPRAASVTAGEILIDGIDVAGASERTWARKRGASISLIPQDPTVSLDPVYPIGRQIAEVLAIHGTVPRALRRERVLELLRQVGIDRPEQRADQFPHQLSGGQRQRVLIAIAIANNPSICIADEPTSGLDVTVQKRVLDQIDQLRAEHETGILLITHDLAVAADRADRIIVLEKGRIVEQGTRDEVLGNPTHPYTRALLEAAPSLTAVPAARPDVLVEAPTLLRITDLHKTYGHGQGAVAAVNGISLEVKRGTTLAIVGESGSGKSTTARIITGLETATSGTLDFDGVDLHGASARTRRQLSRRIQLVQQNPFSSLDPRFTLAEIIGEPLRAFGASRSARTPRVLELLDQVRLPRSFAGRRPGELSGGQRQRIAIARALAAAPDFVVLDEPVSALDVSVQKQILDVLNEIQRETGVTYLLISHDLAVVRLIAHEVAVMQAGEIVESGPTADVFERATHPYTRRLIDAIPGSRHQVSP